MKNHTQNSILFCFALFLKSGSLGIPFIFVCSWNRHHLTLVSVLEEFSNEEKNQFRQINPIICYGPKTSEAEATVHNWDNQIVRFVCMLRLCDLPLLLLVYVCALCFNWTTAKGIRSRSTACCSSSGRSKWCTGHNKDTDVTDLI